MTRDEFQQTCSVRRLNVDDRIAMFDCADEDLNDFLLNESHLYRKSLLSVTYVVERKSSNEVVAYFSLANDKVSLSDFESKTDFNRFRIPFYIKNGYQFLNNDDEDRHTRVMYFDLASLL